MAPCTTGHHPSSAGYGGTAHRLHNRTSILTTRQLKIVSESTDTEQFVRYFGTVFVISNWIWPGKRWQILTRWRSIAIETLISSLCYSGCLASNTFITKKSQRRRYQYIQVANWPKNFQIWNQFNLKNSPPENEWSCTWWCRSIEKMLTPPEEFESRKVAPMYDIWASRIVS